MLARATEATRATEAAEPPQLIEAITGAITRCCGHRPLKARRLAHGWTIEAAVAAFHAMCQQRELGVHALHVRSWLEWEAGEHPRASYQDLLCRLFRTDPVSLGFSRAYPDLGAEPEWRPLMTHTPAPARSRAPGHAPRHGATSHDDSCAHRIRVLCLAQADDPPEPPASLLHAIAAEIISCCGQQPLRAHRLAYGWTVTTAIRALNRHCAAADLRQPGISNRAWQDWEAGKRPNRHNQDLLCRLFATGPVELGFARDYAEPPATDSSTATERPVYTEGTSRPPEGGPGELSPYARPVARSAVQPGRPARPPWPDPEFGGEFGFSPARQWALADEELVCAPSAPALAGLLARLLAPASASWRESGQRPSRQPGNEP